MSRKWRILLRILLIGNMVGAGWDVFYIVKSNAGDFLWVFYVFALVLNVIAIICVGWLLKFGRWES